MHYGLPCGVLINLICISTVPSVLAPKWVLDIHQVVQTQIRLDSLYCSQRKICFYHHHNSLKYTTQYTVHVHNDTIRTCTQGHHKDIKLHTCMHTHTQILPDTMSTHIHMHLPPHIHAHSNTNTEHSNTNTEHSNTNTVRQHKHAHTQKINLM